MWRKSKQSLSGSNLEFSSSKTDYHTKIKSLVKNS